MTVIQVLLIEDNPSHTRLIQRYLATADEITIDLAPVTSLEEAFEYLENGTPDLALLDLNLSDSRGLETFTNLRLRHPDLTTIVLSSLQDRELALLALRDGAQDYLCKDSLESEVLVRSILYARERRTLIDELTRTHAELEQKAALLERKNSELERLRKLISRDFQLSLGAIESYAIQLGDSLGRTLDGLQLKILDNMTRSAHRLKDVIQELQNFSRQSRTPSTNSREVVEELVTLLTPDLDEVGGSIICGELEPVAIPGKEFRELFTLLLEYAIRRRSPGRDPRIEISCQRREDDFAEFTIRDNGPEVEESQLARLFPDRRRVLESRILPGRLPDGSTGSPASGDLLRCQQIVDSHGGRIRVVPPSTSGLTFSFTLPLALAVTSNRSRTPESTP